MLSTVLLILVGWLLLAIVGALGLGALLQARTRELVELPRREPRRTA